MLLKTYNFQCLVTFYHLSFNSAHALHFPFPESSTYAKRLRRDIVMRYMIFNILFITSLVLNEIVENLVQKKLRKPPLKYQKFLVI